MSKQVRFRRGTTAQHATFTGPDGEVTFDTDKKCLVVHDGISPGGRPLAGFLVLDPGNPESVQALLGCLALEGTCGDDPVLSVPAGNGRFIEIGCPAHLTDVTARALELGGGLTVLGEGDDELGLRVVKNTQVDGAFSVLGGATVQGGLAVSGGLLVNSPFALQLIRVPEDLAWASPFALNFGLYAGYKITLAGNLTFTTQGLEPSRRLSVVLFGDASSRTLTWPAGWHWVGSAAPSSLAANKAGWLDLLSTTSADAGVVARWRVES